MDNIVLTDKLEFGKGLNFGIQQSEGINKNFFNTTNSKINDTTKLPNLDMDYFKLINQIFDIDNRITVLEKGKENTIENIIVAAEKLHKNMAELKDNITFESDIQELSYNYLMDALREFATINR